VVYYQDKHAAPVLDEGSPVAELSSSNPAVPAFFIDKPVEAQWPFYCEFDGSADNTFDALPEALRGAGFVSTPRLSKPNRRTEISLRLARAGEIFVMFTDGSPVAEAIAREGFADTGLRGEWRDNDLKLVPYRLFRKSAAVGQRVRVPPATGDYVVLVKAVLPLPARGERGAKLPQGPA